MSATVLNALLFRGSKIVCSLVKCYISKSYILRRVISEVAFISLSINCYCAFKFLNMFVVWVEL